MRLPRIAGSSLAGSLFVLALVACGDKQGAGAMADSARRDSGSPTVPARQLGAMPMLPPFRAHLDSVAAKPAMIKSSMSGHMAEVHKVMEAMHADMMAAGMHSDAAYEALADSVVKASAALGRAKDKDLSRLVAMQVDQLRRLTAVYEQKAAAM
ncbi:MAG: hypothetical protein H0W67_08740 [Gemmatimonadales bacterium]|nr:hypothetical protein [Gemmatimonadales bacterium]